MRIISKPKTKYSKKYITKFLKNLIKLNNNVVPTYSQLRRSKYQGPSLIVIQRAFGGSYDKAVESTGFKVERKHTIYTNKRNKDIFEKFNKGVRTFYCDKHGYHDDWKYFYVKKSKFSYIVCEYCHRENSNNLSHLNYFNTITNSAKKHARRYKIKFSITPKDIWQKIIDQKNRCIYTNQEFDKFYNKPSLDQIRPRGGYTVENTQLVNPLINVMKSDLDEKKFLYYCKLISGKKKKIKNSLFLANFQLRTTKSDILNNIKIFKNTGEFNCKKHGLHKHWKIQNDDIQTRFRCKLCLNDQRGNSKLKKNNTKVKIKRILPDLFNRTKFDSTKGKYIKFGDKKYFDIQYSELVDLYISQNGQCKYTGIVFDDKKNKPSMDRIDSSVGYFRHNIQLVLYDINRMKSNILAGVFLNLAKEVSKNSKKIQR